MVDLSIYSGWWCNVPILKNGGVKVHGFRMTSLFYEMEHKIPWFETTKQYFKSQVGHFAGYLWRSQDGSAISSHLWSRKVTRSNSMEAVWPWKRGKFPFKKLREWNQNQSRLQKMGHSPCLELSSSLAFKRSSSFRRSCSSGDEKKWLSSGKNPAINW